MTVEQLREALIAKPFRPFTLELSSGTEVHVPHPDFLMVGPGGRTAFAWVSEDAGRFIDLLHITSLQFCDGQARREQEQKRKQ